MRDAVFSNRKKLGSQQFKDGKARSKYFIDKSLTKANKALFKTCLGFKKVHGYKYIWTKYGVTHLKERDDSPFIIIKSKKDLVKHGIVWFETLWMLSIQCSLNYTGLWVSLVLLELTVIVDGISVILLVTVRNILCVSYVNNCIIFNRVVWLKVNWNFTTVTVFHITAPLVQTFKIV